MTILPLTYLGNIEYFATLLGGDCTIDLYENYIKQTFRNRCEIMTAGGISSLTVNVTNGGSITKRAVRDMRIDYSKRWQHQHRMSIISSYRNSPYFDHYWERFEPLFNQQFTFLADLNNQLLETTMNILGNPAPLVFSNAYIHATAEDFDMRNKFNPKTALHTPQQAAAVSYEQVFAERFAFHPNLSVIDLIFCEGPHSKNILNETAKIQAQ